MVRAYFGFALGVAFGLTAWSSNPASAADAPAAEPVQKSEPAPAAPAAAASPVAEAQAPTAPAAPAPVTPVKTATPKPETTLAIDIDLTRQRMTVTEYGKEVGTWAISSGREGYRSPTGTYRPLWSSKMWYSKKYDNAPMPHAVFFSGGVAMHATQATGMLGHPASHGCIRQSPANAATTYKLVAKHGNAATRIVVHGKPHDDEPRVARRDAPSSDARMAAQRYNGRQIAAAPGPAMRRVLLIDSNGFRRVAEIPANDPRLIAYYQRVKQMQARRPAYAQAGGNFKQAW
jgi:lipoprotein-anchoring transpeptidase ErfK/SrfK